MLVLQATDWDKWGEVESNLEPGGDGPRPDKGVIPLQGLFLKSFPTVYPIFQNFERPKKTARDKTRSGKLRMRPAGWA